MSENQSQELAQVSHGGQLATGHDAESLKEFRMRMEEFTARLNRPPEKAKIQSRTEAGQTYQYLPVSVVENDLRKFYFGLIQFHLISDKIVVNEYVVNARIKVFHPVLMQWMDYDGTGASVIQQDKDTSLLDFMLYKKKNAMKLAAPLAYAEAIKNAAKKIGKRFGGDLNRKEEDFYQKNYKDEENPANRPLNS